LFCAATESALHSFQVTRGLRGSGICDETTWLAIVEASWKLGDRLLVLTSPNMRGDDVAELQTLLARLGFDCGRPDGILGPATARALLDFQANCGLPPDGVCGVTTVQALRRVSGQTGTGPGVAAVREREFLRRGMSSLAACRIAVGQLGGLSTLTRILARELRLAGATVISFDEPDVFEQARSTNHFGAHAYVGFESSADTIAVAHYYQVPSFESAGGRALAENIVAGLANVPGMQPVATGMRLPILRETKMPAVLCVIGPVRTSIDHAPSIASGVLAALTAWASPTG
jgi:N-acetylmuramoyl-L-alanine amidase